VGAVAVLAVTSVAVLAHVATLTGVRSAEGEFVAARAELSTHVETYLHSVRQWVAWQATATALDRVDSASSRLGHATARSARATALGHALVVLACGAGLVLAGWLMAGPLTAGELSPAM